MHQPVTRPFVMYVIIVNKTLAESLCVSVHPVHPVSYLTFDSTIFSPHGRRSEFLRLQKLLHHGLTASIDFEESVYGCFTIIRWFSEVGFYLLETRQHVFCA